MNLSKAGVFVLPVIYIGYVILGGIVFHYLERDNEKEDTKKSTRKIEDFLANKTCVSEDELRSLIKTVVEAYEQGLLNNLGEPKEDNDEGWAIHKSIYFATTVVSTIGYGNISPVTQWGRIFCVFFAVFGIPLALVMYGKTGVALDKLNATLTGKLVKDKDSKASKILRAGINVIGGVAVFILLPPLWFRREEDWSYAEGCYYAFITVTTIGFGDYVAGFEENNRLYYHLCVSLWIVLGLAWMSSLVSNMYEIANHNLDKAVNKIHSGGDSSHNGDEEKIQRDKYEYSKDPLSNGVHEKIDDSCTVGAIDESQEYNADVATSKL